MSENWWMVRAGRSGDYAQDFESENCVAFGGERSNGLAECKSPDDVRAHVKNRYANLRKAQIRMRIAQCIRFTHDIQQGDRVVTYDPDRRTYLIGKIKSDCKPGKIGELLHIRDVEWDGRAIRDDLTVASKNSLGSIMSVFSINAGVAAELERAAHGERANDALTDDYAIDEVQELRLESERRGREFIEDHVASLEWDQMEELVAGLLRAMGYKTRVSPAGPDRGRDIMASPDGLGLSQPRIIAEVKHRPKSPSDATMSRSFLGGRRPGDNCMFVSTGGFTKDARYEAERANVPLALVTLEELVDLLIQHYPNADAETRAMVPLMPVYWPA